MTGLKSAITKITLLEFALSYSRIYVDFATFRGRFIIAHLLFDMVFVHVFRCLIFKVHRPCSLYKISVVSSVSLNRSDLYILAHRNPEVKNFFRFPRYFFLALVGTEVPSAARSHIIAPTSPFVNTFFAIFQTFFGLFRGLYICRKRLKKPQDIGCRGRSRS